MALSEEQEDAIIVIYTVTSIISLIADCLIIFGYLRFKALQKLAFTFVFCIALADCTRSLAQTWGNVGHHGFFCKFQGWLQTFGAVAMGLWFATIAAVCISIKKMSGWWKTKTQKDIKRLEIKIIAIVTGINDMYIYSTNAAFKYLVIAIICASVPWNYYSYGSGWCWISSTNTGTIFRYCCYYGWLIACLLFSVIVYCELFRIVRQETKILNEQEVESPTSVNSVSRISVSNLDAPTAPAPSTLDTKRRQKRMFDQMRLYPLALIIGQGPGAVRRIIELITGNAAPFWLTVIHALCSGLFGFITAVIYGSKTWETYQYKVKKMCNLSSTPNETKRVVSGTDI